MLALNNYMTQESNGWEPGVLPPFITLHILNNDKTKTVMSVHYYNAWPSMMGDLEYSFTDDGDPAINLNVTFHYSHFAIEKNGVIIETRESISDKLIKGKSPK
ncbi:tail completion and sheath stabilizer protein [Acinetobacter phage Henu6]|nr:tail completion and sheath stabilizer protein [Acinetobacter phage Henu6]